MSKMFSLDFFILKILFLIDVPTRWFIKLLKYHEKHSIQKIIIKKHWLKSQML